MEITSAAEGEVLIAGVSGEVDAGVAPDLEARLLELARKPGARLAVDLSGVNFISSAGLRVLFQAGRAKQAQGGEMRLFGLRPQVLKVFQLSGFDTILRVCATREEAAGI